MTTMLSISSTPLFHARLHARPPGGAEPQAAQESERQSRGGERRARELEELASAGGGDLGAEARARLAELAARDRAVRAHEAAHARAGGRYAGPPRYDYVQGPDGKRYAVAGQVQIDVSPSRGDPEATIAKMRVVKAAALAPADPSPQDRRVAALADRLARAAEADLRAEARAREAWETARLGRLSALFAQTALLPAPEPSWTRAA